MLLGPFRIRRPCTCHRHQQGIVHLIYYSDTYRRMAAIEGFEGLYEVLNRGRVRSCDRVLPVNRIGRFLKGKVLSPDINDWEFLKKLTLQKKENCIAFRFPVLLQSILFQTL
jgi:hypothetical protein